MFTSFIEKFSGQVKKVLCLASLLLPLVCAADYSQHPRAQALVDELVEKHSFTEQEVRSILSLANTEQRILDSMANAAEKTKTWTAYRTSFLSPFRVSKGVEFLDVHRDIFDRVEAQYGVPREIITAILGVETNYGGYTGKANVLSALATLAFEHPRRYRYFTTELKEYILLSRERNWQVEEQQGSYAGAMGFSQFMPSNYRRLAVDGDGDGKANLHEPADAIASVANYFVHHGWSKGAPVASRAAVNPDFNQQLITKGMKPRYSLAQLADGGFYPQDNIEPATEAVVIRFNDADGDEFWLGYNNFYVIGRYNPRSKYAMAVYHLSREIQREQLQLAAAQRAAHGGAGKKQTGAVVN